MSWLFGPGNYPYPCQSFLANSHPCLHARTVVNYNSLKNLGLFTLTEIVTFVAILDSMLFSIISVSFQFLY